MDHQVVANSRHRAAYTLEAGVWSARCRLCGFTVKDNNRQRAATWFLTHIRAVRLQLGAGTSQLPAPQTWKAEDAGPRGVAPQPEPKAASADGGKASTSARRHPALASDELCY